MKIIEIYTDNSRALVLPISKALCATSNNPNTNLDKNTLVIASAIQMYIRNCCNLISTRRCPAALQFTPLLAHQLYFDSSATYLQQGFYFKRQTVNPSAHLRNVGEIRAPSGNRQDHWENSIDNFLDHLISIAAASPIYKKS